MLLSSSSIAVGSNQGILITWRDDGLDGNNQGVFGRRIPEYSEKSDAVFSINQSTDGNQMDSRIVAFADGSFAVVWNSKGANGDGDIVIRN